MPEPVRIVVPDDFPRVLAGTRAHDRLRTLGDVAVFDTAPGSDAELIRRLEGATVALNIRAYCAFNREVLAATTTLRLISIWGTGTDNVDLGAARQLGVAVTNTPGVNAVAVAEHTLALILAVVRRLPHVDAEIRRGRWPRSLVPQLRGKTLGVLGLGAIGRHVARFGRALGMEVLAWTFHPTEERARGLGVAMASLDEVLARADVLSIHLRLSPESRGLVGRAQLARMKPTAFLVNTARGAIVEEEALCDALEAGRLAGAGLDAFVQEPLPPDHRLLRLPNVVLTPHSGATTPEVIEEGLDLAVENVARFLRGDPINLVVPPPSPKPA